MAGELQQHPCAVGDPGSGRAAAAADRVDVSSGERRSGVRVLFTDPGMHYSDGGYCHVPIRHAIQHHAEC